MADPRHRFGDAAEDAVAAWLVQCGWTLLGRRFRSPGGGEVDLVLIDRRGTLVGVEVRARRSRRAGAPSETIDARRVRRIGRSLAAYATRSGVDHAGLRIDLVAAEPVPGQSGSLRLRRIANLEE